MAVSCMRNAACHCYRNSSFTVGLAMGQIIPRSTERISSFHGGGVKICEIWGIFQHHSTLSHPRLKMHQDIRTPKQICNAAMIALCPRQVW